MVDRDGTGLRVPRVRRAPLSRLMRDLQQAWPRPAHPRPIVIIGAGAIVRTAHLPVYRRLGYPVAGIVDIDHEQARATAREFAIARVYPSLRDAAGTTPAVFDVAVPGDQ